MQVQEGTPNVSTPRAPGVNARVALTLLVLINLFNYIDRIVLAALVPKMKPAFFPDAADQSAEFWMGMLQFAFLISYMLLAPLFGILADRMSRWFLVGLGVLLWTMASGASGIDWTALGVSAGLAYTLLFATRCFVGIGEAAYGPVAPAMISDLFPVSKRGKVMAWFYLAIPVGGALGYALGGVVTHVLQWSWHWAFFLVVPPGLLLGAWCFLMPDPPRGLADAGAAAALTRRESEGQAALEQPPVDIKLAVRVLHIPSYLYNTLGMTAMTFAIGGLSFWMPAYFNQQQTPGLFGLDPNTTFGGITAIAGFAATIAGGILGDRLRPRFSGSYFLVSGAALLIGFPMVLAFLATPFPYAWLFVFASVFCLFFNTGPTNTILANVTHPATRASAFALNILIIHLFGDALSPPLLGLISRLASSDPEQPNYAAGFAVVSATMLLGGLFWLGGARHLERDTQAATSFSPAP